MHHKRGDAVPAYETEVALPHEISESERKVLARKLAEKISSQYGVGVDYAVHTSEGAGGNWHAHLVITACQVSQAGLGKKQNLLDPIWCSRNDQENFAKVIRPYWEDLANGALELSKSKERVDHRSLEAQGVDRIPQIHVGPNIPEMRPRRERNAKIKEENALNAELKSIEEDLEKIRVAEQSPEAQARERYKEHMKRLVATGGRPMYTQAENQALGELLADSTDRLNEARAAKKNMDFEAGVYGGLQEAFQRSDLREAMEDAARVYHANGKTAFDSGRYHGLKYAAEAIEALREQERPAPKPERPGKEDDFGY